MTTTITKILIRSRFLCVHIRSLANLVLKLQQCNKPAAVCVININQTAKEKEKVTQYFRLNHFSGYNKD